MTNSKKMVFKTFKFFFDDRMTRAHEILTGGSGRTKKYGILKYAVYFYDLLRLNNQNKN